MVISPHVCDESGNPIGTHYTPRLEAAFIAKAEAQMACKSTAEIYGLVRAREGADGVWDLAMEHEPFRFVWIG